MDVSRPSVATGTLEDVHLISVDGTKPVKEIAEQVTRQIAVLIEAEPSP